MMRKMHAAPLALLAAGLAAAQPATPPPVDAPAANESNPTDIVVVGRLREALTRFVQRLTQAGPTDQVARWKAEICPEVYGIDPAQAQFVRARIGAVARSLRLRVGRNDCPATMYIVVTPEAAAFAAEMERLYPISLRADGRARLKRFVASTKPVRWISVSDECPDGCTLPNSRLVKATQPALSAMIVVVDAKQIGGISIGELADYLALVSLANPPADESPQPNSILAMFDEPRGTNPFQLTDFDLSFLSALYRVAMDRDARSQRAQIANTMRRELERNAPERPQGN